MPCCSAARTAGSSFSGCHGAPRFEADRRQLLVHRRVVRVGRDERQEEADVAPVGFAGLVALGPGRPLDGGGRRRRRCPEERAERLELVALLDLLHARKVLLAADHLRAGERAEQVALAAHDTLDAGRRLALPGRRGQQVAVRRRCRRSPSRGCRGRSPSSRPTGWCRTASARSWASSAPTARRAGPPRRRSTACRCSG